MLQPSLLVVFTSIFLSNAVGSRVLTTGKQKISTEKILPDVEALPNSDASLIFLTHPGSMFIYTEHIGFKKHI